MCLDELSFAIRPERRITKGSADTAVADNYFLKYSDRVLDQWLHVLP